ncbi:MAG: aminotransferase class I/II-fold pyridoxal phosphate-dependent enzyme [Oscillospiraceae bacterium]|nr:aminotransferase class I/II-fold pyridoxal phosphate-dependent enzyme [Oscillospiraceae bacterium]MBP1560679.1 aminotransferase class I/II-fold pyridoxal phosphate-dependent enzyme [Oscillospiraceae bacterium]
MLISGHGGDIYSRQIEYDFSANLNPLGMPESVKAALKNSVSEWESYPDPLCRKLSCALSEYEDFPDENIVCGNGAADLIYRLVSAVKPRKAVITAPAFSEYEKALKENGSQTIKYFLSEENSFIVDDGILNILDSSFDMIFLCNPNNPTGQLVTKDILKAVAEKCLENNIILVCDECFLPFVNDGKNKSVREFMNEKVIILNAFTKIYAMAGLRLGYALFGSCELAEKVQKTGQYWSVSTPAQLVGIAALQEKDYIEKTIQFIKNEREFLITKLQEFGFKVYNSEANFILFRCDVPLDKMLLKEKIAIRNCSNYDGLSDGYFRIAVRNHEENCMLISAVRRCFNG